MPVESAHQPAFDGHVEQTHPRALRRGAGDDGVELLADAAIAADGGGGFGHLPLDFLGGVFLLGAVLGDLRQVRRRIGRALPAMAAFSRRWVIKSGNRRLGAVEWV